MSGPEARIWAIALSLSLGVHGAMLWQVRTSEAESGRGKPTTTVTRVRFNSVSAAPSQMNAVVEPKPKPKPKPPAEKAPAAAEMPVPKEEEQPPSEAALQATESGREDSTASVPGAATLAELRKSYQTQLLAHIEGKKFYPEAARRRGIVGGVRVGFIVGPGGAVAALECGQGPSVLAQAACEAVRRAVPLPIAPPELQLPMPVSFVMDYSLK